MNIKITLLVCFSLVAALIIVSAVTSAISCYYRERNEKQKHAHEMEKYRIRLEIEKVKLKTEKEKTKREALKNGK